MKKKSDFEFFRYFLIFFLQILPHPCFPSTSLWCFLFAGIRCAFVSLRITVISFISSLCRIVVVLVRFPFQEFAYRSSFSRGFLSRTLLSFCVCDTNIPIYLYTDPVWKEVRWQPREKDVGGACKCKRDNKDSFLCLLFFFAFYFLFMNDIPFCIYMKKFFSRQEGGMGTKKANLMFYKACFPYDKME